MQCATGDWWRGGLGTPDYALCDVAGEVDVADPNEAAVGKGRHRLGADAPLDGCNAASELVADFAERQQAAGHSSTIARTTSGANAASSLRSASSLTDTQPSPESLRRAEPRLAAASRM